MKLYNFLLSKLFFNSPNVSYLQPKVLNLYFSNSLHPSYMSLNLTKMTSFNIFLKQETKNNTNVFVLCVAGTNDNGKEISLDVAEFETRAEAEDACNTLRNKLFSVGNSLIRKMVVFAILLYLFFVSFIFIPGMFLKPGSASQVSQMQQQLSKPMSSDPTNAEITQALQQAEMQRKALVEASQNQAKKAEEQIKSQQAQPESPPQEGNIDDFLKRLKKD